MQCMSLFAYASLFVCFIRRINISVAYNLYTVTGEMSSASDQSSFARYRVWYCSSTDVENTNESATQCSTCSVKFELHGLLIQRQGVPTNSQDKSYPTLHLGCFLASREKEPVALLGTTKLRKVSSSTHRHAGK